MLGLFANQCSTNDSCRNVPRFFGIRRGTSETTFDIHRIFVLFCRSSTRYSLIELSHGLLFNRT